MGIFSPYEVPGIDRPEDGFNPGHLCLAYIRFDVAGIAVRHAYFAMPPDLESFAAAQFRSVAADGQWATDPIRSEANFENFTFGSPQLVVFHIDPAGAPVRFDPGNLVQFAEWSARGPRTPQTRKSRNNSFFNAAIARWSGLEVLSLENRYLDDAGEPIPPGAEFHYSMNLHALARCAEGVADLPLVLDPDTGNMGSNP